ncbi:MAG: hypothetical protein ABIK63_07570 [candidate division WOR-3 bacterium]
MKVRNAFLIVFIGISFIFAQEHIPFEEWDVDKNAPMSEIVPPYFLPNEEVEEFGGSTDDGWEHKLKVKRGYDNTHYYLSAEAWTKKTGAKPHFLDLWYNVIFNKLQLFNLHEGFRRNPYYYLYPATGGTQWPHRFENDQVVELRDGDIWKWPKSPLMSWTLRAASGHMGYEPNQPGDNLDVFDVNMGKKYNPDKKVREE